MFGPDLHAEELFHVTFASVLLSEDQSVLSTPTLQVTVSYFPCSVASFPINSHGLWFSCCEHISSLAIQTTVPDQEAGHIWKLDTLTLLGNYSMELRMDFCSIIGLLLGIFFNVSSGPFPCYLLYNFDISFSKPQIGTVFTMYINFVAHYSLCMQQVRT